MPRSLPSQQSSSPPDQPDQPPTPSRPAHIAADALIPAVYLGSSPIYLSRDASGGRRFVRADGTPLQPKRIEVQVPNARGRLAYGGFGKPRTITQTVYALDPGDSLLMPAGEILGLTFLHPYAPDSDAPDALDGRRSYVVGAGWCPLPEHATVGLDWSPDLRLQPFTPQSGPQEARASLYVYDYHEGRHDFAPLPPYDDPALLPAYLRPHTPDPSTSTPPQTPDAAAPDVAEAEAEAEAPTPDDTTASPEPSEIAAAASDPDLAASEVVP